MEKIIKAAVERGASDLHIKAGDVFRARINGKLVALTKQRLTPDQTRAIALKLISSEEDRARIDRLRDFDCSWGMPGVGRFRVNVLRQRSSFMIVMRVIPFTVPMMYPYHLIADGERIPLKYHDLYVANPVAEAVMLIQRGFWYPTCAPGCAVDPGSGAPLPEFVSDLFPRGFVMLAVGLAILALGQFVFSRLEKTVPERL